MKYRFDGYSLSLERAELSRGHEEIPLEPLAYRLLCLLVENHDRMVPKEELVEKVWKRPFISDAAISTLVKVVRHALGDDGAQQKFIRTVRGRGFRFVAPVRIDTESVNITTEHGAANADGDNDTNETPSQALPDKPSIAVLPFQLLGRDSQDSVLADAIPHDLIQALSQLRWLFVIARGSTFRFRTLNTDVQEIGKALNVGYVLAGSIETRGSVSGISVELSDCRTGEVVWAKRFNATTDDAHDIRTQIIARVVSSLEVYIPMNEARIARLNVSENLDAWSNYHLGLHHMYRFTKEGNARATGYFEKSVLQDPLFARAHAGLSFTSFQDAFVSYNDDPQSAALAARRFAERSLELDAMDPFSNLTMGRAYWLDGDLENALDWLNRAITLSPNYAQGHYSHAFSDVLSGGTDTVRANVDTALNLSPLDPLVYGMFGTLALSYVSTGDYQSASNWAEKAARAPGAHFLIAMMAVAAHTLNGEQDKANVWACSTKNRRPDANLLQFFAAFPFTDAVVRNKLKVALLKSGFK